MQCYNNRAKKMQECGDRFAAYDARGIFLCYTCSKCEARKLASYRPEVLDDPNYEACEAIEED